MFREMKEQGMSVSEIARRTGVNRLTIIKHMLSEEPPKYGSGGNGRASVLEPYKPYVRKRIEGYSLSAVRILNEIREKGYKGEYSTLKNYCHTIRKDMRVKAIWRFETKPG